MAAHDRLTPSLLLDRQVAGSGADDWGDRSPIDIDPGDPIEALLMEDPGDQTIQIWPVPGELTQAAIKRGH
jgi:hypothetical protein